MLTLYEDSLGEFNDLQNVITQWYQFNKRNIHIISAIYADSESYEGKDIEVPGAYKRCIRIRYEGVAGINPQECSHSNLSEYVLVKPTCTRKGRSIFMCKDCGFLSEERTTNVIDHNWHSNGDGTHSCIVEDGCGVTTETCYPNDYGDVCLKCGYHTPDDIILEITTSFVNGMSVNAEFSQQLESNADSRFTTWELTSGSLPDGITLSSDGIISGIPTEYGVFSFNIQATYHDQTATKSYSVNVAKTSFTVTFDPQEGTASESVRIVPQGSTIGELPTASRDEYVFGGWFTAPVDGLKIDENYTISSDVTLYARWGQGSDIQFGDATSSFNIQVEGDRTNFQNYPYTIYHRYHETGNADNLITQVGIYSENGTNNMSDDNKIVKLYLKVTNQGEAGYFDIGFDCDSYVNNDDCLYITRIENGVQLGLDPVYFTVTVPYETSIWVGKYSNRTANRYKDVSVGTCVGNPGANAGGDDDTGYAFTMNNIFINNGSYVILEVTFEIP
jgi:hypothetical protein